jgi:TetR/AcrR family acrAB operon transcriptional repressor
MAVAKLSRSQAERRERAEQKILDAAIKLIVKKGYDRFTLVEIGEAAGYSRGLPAHYFGKKEDLLSEVARYLVELYHKTMAARPAAERGLPQLIEYIRLYRQGAGTIPNRALGVLIAEAGFHPKLKATIKHLNDRGLNNLATEIRLGIECGNIRPDVNVWGQAALIYAFVRGQMTFAAIDPKLDVVTASEEFIAMLEQRLIPT